MYLFDNKIDICLQFNSNLLFTIMSGMSSNVTIIYTKVAQLIQIMYIFTVYSTVYTVYLYVFYINGK